MGDDFNYYELLGLVPDSSPEDIRTKINKMIRGIQAEANNPDKQIYQRANDERKVLLEARDILLDPDKRKKYDKKFGSSQVPKLQTNKAGKKVIPKPQLSYSIVLMLDTSGSMRGEKIEDAREALNSFLETLDLEENEVALVTFGIEVTSTESLTQDSHCIKKEIEGLTANGGTPMMRAIKFAHKEILTIGKASPVIVVATDGIPTDSSEEEILDYAKPIKESGTWVITIGIGEDVNEEFLKRLASSSQDYHFAKESFELKKIYKKVVSGLVIRKE